MQRHNELRNREAVVINLVCHGLEVEPALQEVTGELLAREVTRAPDSWLDLHARGFWSNTAACHATGHTVYHQQRRSR